MAAQSTVLRPLNNASGFKEHECCVRLVMSALAKNRAVVVPVLHICHPELDAALAEAETVGNGRTLPLTSLYQGSRKVKRLDTQQLRFSDPAKACALQPYRGTESTLSFRTRSWAQFT